jgi:hypothetical protein
MRAAQNTLRRGGDVLAPSREMARQVAKGAASKGEKVVHHAPHKERYRPHFQIDGKAGHSFYSVIPLAGLGSMVGRKTGSELLGEAIDFLNPLSDLQDVSDFLTYLSSIQEEDALARAEWIMP